MANILVIDDECELLELLSMLIEGELGHHVVRASSAEEGIAILTGPQDISLIICDWNMPGGGGLKVLASLEKMEPLPFIFMSGSLTYDLDIESYTQGLPFFCVMEKPFEMDEFLSHVEKGLTYKHSIPSSAGPREGEYSKISFNSLAYEAGVPHPFYLKLSEKKFVKIVSENEQSLTDLIDHYRSKDVDSFYMKREDFRDWVHSIFKEHHSYLETFLQDDRRDRLCKITHVCKTFHTRFHLALSNFGVDKEHILVVNEVIEEIVKELNERPNLSELLKLMLKSENYLSDHTFFVIFLASYLAKDLGLTSESTTRKIVHAAFFHDLAISNESAVASESVIEDITDKETYEMVRAHPEEVVKLLSPHSEFQGDITHMILEHHERPDGSGYPRGLDAGNIHPLSCLFILCHKASELFLLEGRDSTAVAQFFKGEEGEFYNIGNFRRPLQVLRRHFAL